MTQITTSVAVTELKNVLNILITDPMGARRVLTDSGKNALNACSILRKKRCSSSIPVPTYVNKMQSILRRSEQDR
jgi:hypothetical protein